MAISMLKIRRPLGRLIFNMGIAIPGKTVFLIETAPWSSYVKMASSHVMQGEHVYEDIRYMARIPPAALDAVKTMTFRDDDVLLVTYPKAGTTWLSQITCLLLEQDVSEDIRKAVPIVEFSDNKPPNRPLSQIIEEWPSPRILTTHLLPHFFDNNLKDSSPRIIVIMRNPKDCLVSYFHYYRATGALGKFKGTFDDFFELNKENGLCYGDVITHIAAWWKYKDDPRVLFLTYEGMKREPEKYIKEIVDFLKLDRSDEVIREVVDKSSFKKMSEDSVMNKDAINKEVYDSSVSKYLRKGQVGDWQNYFSDEQSKEFNDRYQKELEPLGVKLEFTA